MREESQKEGIYRENCLVKGGPVELRDQFEEELLIEFAFDDLGLLDDDGEWEVVLGAGLDVAHEEIVGKESHSIIFCKGQVIYL